MWNRLKSLQRFATVTTKRVVKWRQTDNFLELNFFIKNRDRNMIFVVGEETTFSELQSYVKYQFKYPKDFDPNTNVIHFLTKEQTPMTIEVRNEDDVSYINNRAKQPEMAALLRGLQNKKGFYRLLSGGEMDMQQIRSLVTVSYLKLQGESYCKLNNIAPKAELTPALREEMLNYICYRNETNEQKNITALQTIKEEQLLNIMNIQKEVKEIEADADRILQLYQLGAIGVTTAHLFSFGYMIFFVDWLGWDIIEPLTFSVSSLYFLIGLRFYRKFRRDRNQQSIRDHLRKLILNPKKLMRLQSLSHHLKQQKERLTETDLKLQISKNRLSLSTTMIAAIHQ